MYAPYVVGSNLWGGFSATHFGSGVTRVSKSGSQKNAQLCRSLAPRLTTRCTVDFITPLVHRSIKSPTLQMKLKIHRNREPLLFLLFFFFTITASLENLQTRRALPKLQVA